MLTSESVKDMSLGSIARVIGADWKSVNYAAVPYLRAMYQLDNMSDYYFNDDGRSVVAYFLNNARAWRGEVAKIVKAELNRRLGNK